MDTGKVKRESQISNAFGRLDKTISDLESVIEIHERSLSAILRDEPQLKDGNNREVMKEEVKVSVAMSLDNFSDRVYSAVNRINSMQSRLEL